MELEKFLAELGMDETALRALPAKAVELEKKVVDLAAMSKIGEEHLASARKDAEKYYRLLKGDSAKEDFVAIIKKADFSTATAFLEEYKSAAEKAIPLACTKCGGEMSRKSSRTTETGGEAEAAMEVPTWLKAGG